MYKSKNHYAFPPGDTIVELLEDRNMSQKELAARMNMSEKHISKLINGDVILTPETALKLDYVFGGGMKFWLNLEARYREDLLTVNQENQMDIDIALIKGLPYKELVKLNWIEDAQKSQDKVINLRKFFEVIELSLLKNRKITKLSKDVNLQNENDLLTLLFAQQAKLITRQRNIPSYNPKKLTSLIKKLDKIRKLDNPYDILTSDFSNIGISLVLLPKLKDCHTEALTYMDGNKVIIAINEKLKGDEFWHSLYHEVGHLFLGHLKQTNINKLDEENAEKWAILQLSENNEPNLF